MFFTVRDGKAGLGSDHLYVYGPSTHSTSTPFSFTYLGAPLTGRRSNPYIHGINSINGRLHVTWVWRGFVSYPGWDDPLDTKHKQQAGPNGAENNHNICYAWSDDAGYTWHNGRGDVIASLKDGETITEDSDGIVAFDISKGSGLMNQEAQAIDWDGGVHVLNREIHEDKDELRWRHYYRSPEGMCF
jgi:Neuraminidase (sialidase)